LSNDFKTVSTLGSLEGTNKFTRLDEAPLLDKVMTLFWTQAFPGPSWFCYAVSGEVTERKAISLEKESVFFF